MSDTRHSTPEQASPRVLLLVAPEPLAREALAGVLGRLGLTVAEQASAETALRAAEADPGPPPAVLVTDTDLPASGSGGLDGLALAGAARRRWPGLGVVYVTGRPPSRLDGHLLGPRDRFLPRPVVPGALLRVVRGLLASGKLHSGAT